MKKGRSFVTSLGITSSSSMENLLKMNSGEKDRGYSLPISELRKSGRKVRI
jgi:hypothetical protein